MNSVKRPKYQYSSRHHSATQKIWNTKKGAVACSAKSAVKDGMGMLHSFLPYRDSMFSSSGAQAARGSCRAGGSDEAG